MVWQQINNKYFKQAGVASEIFFEKKACTKEKLLLIFASTKAEVAQLVELQPSKLVVASSSLVFRSAESPDISLGFFIFRE